MNQKTVTKYNNIKISKELRDIIHGYIMSGGYVNKFGILTVDQSKQQEKFVEWLYEKLKDVRADNPIKKVFRTHPKTNKQSYSLRFSTRSFLVGFHRMWYKPYINENGVTVFKKSLPKKSDGFFNTTFLTLWFAGDGTKILGSTGAKFEATAFTAGERQILKVLFKKKFDIDVKINKAGFSKNPQWTININASEYKKFRALVAESSLIEDLFAYKLHKKE